MKGDFANPVLENIAEVVCALDENGRILAVNRACLTLWKYEPAELVGKLFVDLLAPQFVSESMEAIQQFLYEKSAESFWIESKIVCKDGVERYALWTGARSKTENILLLISCHHSKTKEAFEQVRASEMRIRTILNHLIIGLVIVSERGYVESMNPRAEAIFGYTAEEIVGKPASDLFAARSKNMDETLFLEAIISSALNKTCEAVCIRSDQRTFRSIVSLSELRTHEGSRYLMHVLDRSEDLVPFLLDDHLAAEQLG
ncbi:MAG: PAS domain-containing protein [Candidatus Obscuribacterales bacterium]|nr:PAS domain-containing protein [Candidatus Obscuribacterales bacterium]